MSTVKSMLMSRFFMILLPLTYPFRVKIITWSLESDFPKFSIPLRFGYNITTSVNKLQYLKAEKFQIISNCYNQLCNLCPEALAGQGFPVFRQILKKY